ncbi:MAG: ATP-binding protein, partial [Candidatus Aminicenantales bacterium]
MAEKTCSLCGGTGWILEEEKDRALAKRCKCYLEKQVELLLEESNIPRRYMNCTLKNFEIHNPSHRDALKISKQFIKNFPLQEVGLLFIGPCGVGKTHLAVAVLRELIEKKKARCCFCDFRELIKEIQRTYSPDSPLTESEVLEPVFQSDVLVLDELGAKRPSAWVEEMIFYIINYRYNHKKLTVFTSNYLDTEEEEDRRDSFYKKKEDTLVDRIGVRLRSRLYEMCKIVDMWG